MTPQLDAVFQTIDERLMNVWLDLRELTTAVDIAHETRRRLSPVLFQEALLSVLYRLERLAFDIQDRNEILRKTLLIFATTTFLDSDLVSVTHHDLIRSLRQTFDLLNLNNDQQSLELSLWVIYVVAAGHNIAHELAWLYQNVLQTSRTLGLHSWSESRQLLKSFLWVDAVRNEAGENLFNGCTQEGVP